MNKEFIKTVIITKDIINTDKIKKGMRAHVWEKHSYVHLDDPNWIDLGEATVEYVKDDIICFETFFGHTHCSVFELQDGFMKFELIK
jgi:hypothetical protein